MVQILVIVESPAKCKKIESFLGQGYKCMATFGHIRNLVSLKDIDIENGFEPKYSLPEEKIKLQQIEKLRKEIEASKDIYLALDGDREGEGIAYHVCQLFNLSIESTKRIVFQEITEKAILTAIRNPTRINMDMVKSQQARQVLDLLVGYTITPILWKYISKGNKDSSLSAGRCQSPALRLIYDNYIKCKDVLGNKVYNVVGYFTSMNLPFELNKQLESQEAINDFLEGTVEHNHIYMVTEPKQTIRTAPEPLITSSLQQLASNELHMSPKETMKYAQELYENGFITYMRTDSKKYSKEFIEDAKKYIITRFNSDKYVNSKIDDLDVLSGGKEGIMFAEDKEEGVKTTGPYKETDAVKPQEAHEAIRPVKISITNLNDNKEINQKSIKLYNLIWQRAVESCMSDAKYSIITAFLTAYNNLKFEYKSEQVVFSGYKELENTYEKISKTYSFLQKLKQNVSINYKKIEANLTIAGLPNHYTEAKLVSLLEDKGIGRPSTFSSLVDKIQERGYVEKKTIDGIEIECEDYILEGNELTTKVIKRKFGAEKNKLVITQLGIVVIEYLINNFDNLFNYDYTSLMENSLDMVAKGKNTYFQICNKCYNELEILINPISEKNEKYHVIIDDRHTFMIAKYGPVIKYQLPGSDNSSVKFLPIKKNIDVSIIKPGVKIEDIIDNEKVTTDISLGKYQFKDLYLKKGKYGLYVEWDTNKVSIQNELGYKPIETITYADVFEILEKDKLLDPKVPIGMLRELNNHLSIRTGKFGDYIFYKTKRLKKPQFFKLNGFNQDYKKCNKDVLLNWIKLTYNVE
jgi:DNA topoisomerase-1